MASYITSIKNWFKSGYEGRHLELFLLEIAKLQPAAMAGYLSKSLAIPIKEFDEVEYAGEVSFPGQRSTRRGDIGIFKADEKDPFILIEIKYFDKPLPESNTQAPQLADYVHWKNQKSGERHVIVLARELYDAAGIEVRRWDDFARAMRKPAEKSDLIKVLVDYLQEEGIVMQNVESESLQRYFTRLVCHTRNVGQAYNNLDGPVEFGKVLRNMQVLSGSFTPRFKLTWKEAGEQIDGVTRSKVATIDFRVRNALVPNKRTYVDEDGELRSDAKDGGVIEIFARHSLGHNAEAVRIYYGILFDVPGSSNGKHRAILYVTITGKKLGKQISHDKEVKYSIVTDDAEKNVDKIEGLLQDKLKLAVTELLAEEDVLTDKQEKALQLLLNSLESGKVPELAQAA